MISYNSLNDENIQKTFDVHYKKNYKLGEYRNIEQLKNYAKKKRNKFSVSLCQRMIDNITIWLKLLIDQDGNQIWEHR